MRHLGFKMWNKLEKRWMDSPIIDGKNGRAMAFSPLDGSFIRYYTEEEVAIVQSTGYLDKDAEEIHEGDYVVMTSVSPGGVDMSGVVEMEEGCWVIRGKEKRTYLYNDLSEVKVIDNVFNSPEYLNQ